MDNIKLQIKPRNFKGFSNAFNNNENKYSGAANYLSYFRALFTVDIDVLHDHLLYWKVLRCRNSPNGVSMGFCEKGKISFVKGFIKVLVKLIEFNHL